jgi:TRAF3-interacting protein 1
MADIDPKIIKKTQDTLGRIIQAPSLTEKLLNRPPVQFVQDIVKSVSLLATVFDINKLNKTGKFSH